MPQTTDTSRASSALLRCLSRLDVDAWAQVLLPKLVEQGSARSVALACTQLRDLCYGTVQQLNLSSLAGAGNSEVQSWLQSVPQHFQHCTSVQLLLQVDASYHLTPYMLPALASLPQLQSISLRVEGVLQPVPMGLVLYILRTQLAGGLRCLHLHLQQSWVGAAPAWREVGQFTMLTKLEFSYDKQVEDPVLEQDLLPLANLHNLKELALDSASRAFRQPLLSAQLADGLTSLTHLFLSGCPVERLRHVRSCTALQVLTMGWPSGLEEELGQQEWAAVGQLTGLVELTLFNAKILSSTAECCDALSKLSRLQTVGAAVWSADLVPALAVCTQLTAVGGCWQPGSSSVEGITLPGVRSLYGAWGCPPFVVLPNLVRVEQAGSLSAAAFVEMAQHCTGLQQLLVSTQLEQVTSLPPDAPHPARIAAIKALSTLTRLVCLQFMVQDGGELAALVDAVGTLLPKGMFQRLAVYLLRSGAVPLPALLHLAKLHGLRVLVLQVDPDLADEIAEYAADVLGALSGIGTVDLVGIASDSVVEKCMLSMPSRWQAFLAPSA